MPVGAFPIHVVQLESRKPMETRPMAYLRLRLLHWCVVLVTTLWTLTPILWQDRISVVDLRLAVASLPNQCVRLRYMGRIELNIFTSESASLLCLSEQFNPMRAWRSTTFWGEKREWLCDARSLELSLQSFFSLVCLLCMCYNCPLLIHINYSHMYAIII